MDEIEEVVDQPGQPLGFAHDDLQELGALLGLEIGRVEQDLGERADRGQRRAQLVADRGQEVVLELVELAQALVGLAQLGGGLLERLRLLLQPLAVLDGLRGLVQDLHEIVGADHLAAHDRAHHHPRTGRADGARELALGQLHQCRRRPRRPAPAPGRGGAGPWQRPCRRGPGPGSGSARPRKAATVASPRHSSPRPRCWSTSTNSTACIRSRLLWRPSSPHSTTRPRLTPRLQTTAWLTGPRPVRPNNACGPQQLDPERAVAHDRGVDQPGRRQGRQDQRVEPDRDAAAQTRLWRRRDWPPSSRGRPGSPARTGRRRRTRSGRC